MPSIQAAYNWAVNTCSVPNVGYSQTYRNQRTVNGITYYDCSSFIWYALIAGGWDMEAIFKSTWPFTTRDMDRVLAGMGFVRHPATDIWVAGDILMKSGHTEMAFDTTRSMGAHTSKVELAQQVSVNANDSRNNGWYALYRWETGAASEWITDNRALATAEQQNNAQIIFDTLRQKGWSDEAIAGLLGNMQTESYISPGVWEDFTPGTGGFGLVQWTPATNYTNWADENGYAHDDGYGQLEWIDSQTVPFGQWIETTEYPLSFAEFKVSKESPEYLAYAFLYNFERPASLDQPQRQTQARYWYEWGGNEYVPPPNPPTTGGDWSSKMPLWMMISQERRR